MEYKTRNEVPNEFKWDLSKMYKNIEFLIVNVLSLPAMYSISKLGCFFTGCCFGIPYNGIFSVYYPGVYFNNVFPINLLSCINRFTCFILRFCFGC